MNRIKTNPVTVIIILIIVSVFCSASLSQAANRLEIRKAMFEKTDIAFREADTYKTRMYAPETLNEAIRYYNNADDAFTNELTFKEINDNLNMAYDLFKKALSIRKQADAIFTEMEDTRQKAHSMRATRFDTTNWDNAERLFKRAVIKLEKGDAQQAENMASESVKYYKLAEVNTVKISYMNKVWDKLKAIENKKEKTFAPKTLQTAKELALKAEKELEKQPYGNEKAQELITMALQQVDRSEKISVYVKNMLDNGKTFEDLILDSGIQVDNLKPAIAQSQIQL
jgi:tetratricopeptide (TPR) repeat protein